MILKCGRLQKEGEVIHVTCDRINDLTDLLHQVGRMSFQQTGRDEGATHSGSPDRGDEGGCPASRGGYHPSFDEDADPEHVVRVNTRDFR